MSDAAPFYSTMGLMFSCPLACAVLRKGKNPSDSFLVKLEPSVPVQIRFRQSKPLLRHLICSCVCVYTGTRELIVSDLSLVLHQKRIYGPVFFAISLCLHAIGVLVLMMSTC